MSNLPENTKSRRQRETLQEAQLALLNGIAEVLMHNAKVEDVLEKLLIVYLEAAGIDKGVVYLFDPTGRLISQQVLGCKKVDAKKLEESLGRSLVLSEVFSRKNNVQLPSSIFPEEINQQFLKDGELASAILVPMLVKEECFGILLLGSREINIITNDILSFSEILAGQISGALALAKTFERILFSEQRYKSLMDNASCGFYVIDQQGIILEVNKQIEKIMHCSKEQLINKDLREFVIPSDRLFATEALQKISIEKQIYLSEIKFNPIGSKHPHVAEFTASEITSNEEILILIVINDVTERNQLRIERLLNDRLATVGALAAGVAHEINSPTAWILSNFSYLKKQFKTMQVLIDKLTTDPELKNIIIKCNEVIEESIQGAERIETIVNNLRGYTRFDEQQLEMTDIHAVLDSALKMTSHEFNDNAQIEKHYASDLPKILLNRGKLHQVFVNIILNAGQAIPKGDIAHNKITIMTMVEKKFLRIDITDTGSGIAEDVLSRIFDPFFTTKPMGAGTGIGLSISREIIKSFSGEIKVESKLGIGSTFSIYIPIKRKEC